MARPVGLTNLEGSVCLTGPVVGTTAWAIALQSLDVLPTDVSGGSRDGGFPGKFPSGFCYPAQLVGDLFPAPTKWYPVTGPVSGPGLSWSCSLFALDGERRSHGDRIAWDGKTPPTAIDLRAGTEFPGFKGG